jgi:AraC family transcriptional regulator
MNWSGKVFLWEEQGLFIGTAGSASLHESPAIKICISLQGNFQLRNSESGDWQNYTSAIIPAGMLHGIEGLGNEMAMFLLAPEGKLGQQLAALTSENIIDVFSPQAVEAALPLIGYFKTPEIDGVEGENIYRQVIEKLAAGSVREGKDAGNITIDPRVSQSIEWIRAGRENGFLVKDIAAEVELSESRFSHLFTENVRVPVRRYLLWLRLRDALHIHAGGGSLTETAHSAGFADSPHLTRTFKTSLGIAPSALVKRSSLVSFLK